MKLFLLILLIASYSLLVASFSEHQDGVLNKNNHNVKEIKKSLRVVDPTSRKGEMSIMLKGLDDRTLVKMIYTEADSLVNSCTIYEQHVNASTIQLLDYWRSTSWLHNKWRIKNIIFSKDKVTIKMSRKSKILRRLLNEKNETVFDTSQDNFDLWTGVGLEQLTKRCLQNSNQIKSFGYQRREGKQPTEPSRRSKRDLRKGLYPGTKWCGRKNSALDGEELGESREADQCCKQHDQCPYQIDSFSSKYYLFNHRFVIIRHCDCDFRYVPLLPDGATSCTAFHLHN